MDPDPVDSKTYGSYGSGTPVVTCAPVQVNFLLEEVGFTLYGAIKQYLEGRLAESIRNQLRPHEGAHPEAGEAGLLTRLCLDYIDIKVGT
jgi:hypothetical protein